LSQSERNIFTVPIIDRLFLLRFSADIKNGQGSFISPIFLRVLISI